MGQRPNGACLKKFATEAHGITRKNSISIEALLIKAFFFRVFPWQ
jgi:hypothetical protein